MSTDDRMQAYAVLNKVLTQALPLSQAMTAMPNMTPFARELSFGVCRHFYRLEAIIEALVEKKLKKATVKVCLMLGLYQLYYLEKADYAVVAETVSMVEKLKATWAKGLVNAVLRRFIRERDTILRNLADAPLFQYGQPAWLLNQWQLDWPLNWQAIATSQDAHPPMTLRVNQKKISTDAYIAVLAEKGITASPHPLVNSAVLLNKPCPVANVPKFAEGYASVQDAAAQLAAQTLQAQDGMRVLDACCAPGGKTGHLLELSHNLQECLAIDVDAKRMDKVRENMERLNLHAHLRVANALHPEYWWDGQAFDRILCDAPCTASGVIRRQPDIKLLRSPKDLQNAVTIQQRMLFALWPLLKPGGILLYATCSIFKDENEAQILKFLETHSDAQADVLHFEVGHNRTVGWQFLPGEAAMDGFFYARLKKRQPPL